MASTALTVIHSHLAATLCGPKVRKKSKKISELVHLALIKNGLKRFFLEIIIDMLFFKFAAETYDITINSDILETIDFRVHKVCRLYLN